MEALLIGVLGKSLFHLSEENVVVGLLHWMGKMSQIDPSLFPSFTIGNITPA
jgi:hypothetical protein